MSNTVERRLASFQRKQEELEQQLHGTTVAQADIYKLPTPLESKAPPIPTVSSIVTTSTTPSVTRVVNSMNFDIPRMGSSTPVTTALPIGINPIAGYTNVTSDNVYNSANTSLALTVKHVSSAFCVLYLPP